MKYSMYMCGTALLFIGMPNKVKYLAILYPVVQYSVCSLCIEYQQQKWCLKNCSKD
jgi:hypothetical protein